MVFIVLLKTRAICKQSISAALSHTVTHDRPIAAGCAYVCVNKQHTRTHTERRHDVTTTSIRSLGDRVCVCVFGAMMTLGRPVHTSPRIASHLARRTRLTASCSILLHARSLFFLHLSAGRNWLLYNPIFVGRVPASFRVLGRVETASSSRACCACRWKSRKTTK